MLVDGLLGSGCLTCLPERVHLGRECVPLVVACMGALLHAWFVKVWGLQITFCFKRLERVNLL